MDIKKFWALHHGTIPSPLAEISPDYPQEALRLTVVDLGLLKVPSGVVRVCDPFAGMAESILDFPVGPGEYPVWVTVADVSATQDCSHLREAYLSLALGSIPPVTVTPAEIPGRPLEPGNVWYVGVDAGIVAFVDATAAVTCMPPDPTTWPDEVFFSDGEGGWYDQLEDPEHLRAGSANVVLPLAGGGENVVMSFSGWGDGFYRVLVTRDAGGRPVGLHIDLDVLNDSS